MKGQRVDKLNSILSGFSVKEEDGELWITASAADLPMKMNMLLQAMASVDDMFLLSQSSVRNLFTEDVGNWLLDNEISMFPVLPFRADPDFRLNLTMQSAKTREDPCVSLRRLIIQASRAFKTHYSDGKTLSRHATIAKEWCF